MKKILGLGLVSAIAAVATPASAATTVNCTVTSGTVLTASLGGIGYTVANGIGTSTGGSTGVISCPVVSAAAGNVITNYKVLATTDYTGGPFGTTSGTSVQQILTIVGGSLNGASVVATTSGGNSSTSNVPPVPFQIGATLSGGTTYAAFTVNDASSVLSGAVGASSGQVVISYDQTPLVPEPATWALMLAGFGLTGAAMRQKKMALSYS